MNACMIRDCMRKVLASSAYETVTVMETRANAIRYRIGVLGTVSLLLVLLGPAVPRIHAQAELTFVPNPVALKPPAAADTSLVELLINSQELVMGAELIFSFDSSRVEVISVARGPFLGGNGGDVADMSTIVPGRLHIVLAVGGGDPEGVAGQGVLATVKLRATSDDPSSEIDSTLCKLRDSTNAVIGARVEDLSVTRADYEPPMTAVLDLPRKTYALVSVPVAFESPQQLSTILSSLGESGPLSWRGYGVTGSHLVENPHLSVGQSFWLSTVVEDDAIAIDGLTPRDTVTVALDAGWNAVGWPWLSVPVSWAGTVLCTDSDTLAWTGPEGAAYVDPTVYWWRDTSSNQLNDGSYDYANIHAGPGNEPSNHGFLVHAESGCALRIIKPSQTMLLELGRPKPTNSHPPDCDRASPDWTLTLRYAPGGAPPQTVEVGTRAGSRIGPDPADVLNPPQFFGGPRLSVLQEGRSWTQYKCAYVPWDSAELTWRIAATGEGSIGRLTWEGVSDLPAGYHPYLIDPDTGRAVDMRIHPGFEFAILPTGRQFHVEVRKRPFDGDLYQSGAPDLRVAALHPVGTTVTIDYQLPTAAPVDLRILDVSGRLVSQLAADIKDAGPQHAEWHRDRSSAASGLYFVYLRTPAFTIARRVVVVR